MLGMYYQVLCEKPVAVRIMHPRTRSFIVVEEAEIPCTSDGKYTVYILLKRGIDTISALRIVEEKFGVKGASRGVLGLKDAEATTVQHILAKDVKQAVKIAKHGEKLLILRKLCKTDIELNKIRYSNRFTIVLEENSAGTSSLTTVEEKLKNTLLPAYYGYQRFGTIRPITHTIGAALAYGQAGLAIQQVLNYPFPDESEKAIALRLARKGIPRNYEETVEKLLEKSVAKPLSYIDKVLRGLGYEALQSLLFNLYLSLRIARGIEPTKPIEGERIGREGLPVALIPGKGKLPGKESRKLFEEAALILGLRLEKLSELPVKPFWRPVAFKPEDLRITKTVLNNKHVIIASFKLPRAMYATVVLREFTLIPY